MSTPKSWAAALTLALVVLVCFGHAESKSRHYAVRVKDPADLQKVADILTQQGLVIKRINKRFSFISVKTPDLIRSAAASNPAEVTAGPVNAPCSDPLGCITGTQASFPGPPASEINQAAAAAADPTISAAFAALPAGVEIEEDAQVYLMGRRIVSRGLLQDDSAAASDASDASTSAAACDALPDSGMVGRAEEDAPYGIKMVQGTDDTVIQLSKDFKNKVMFCVIDTGIDRTHWEFSKDDTRGCKPNTQRTNTNTTSNCKHDWGVDYLQHGTHTGGTIGALRNGKGVVGVSASGAQLYPYNSFGPEETFSMTELVDAWQDCIAELDERKATTGQADLKMVVSMSIGSDGDVKVVREAIKQLAVDRANDVLFVAAAGNGAQQGAVYSYPASYPECVSVAAVNWAKARAPFSQVNNQVTWSAPGVQTLSTIPMKYAAQASYNTQPSLTVSGSGLSRADTEVFSKPGPVTLGGGKAAVVTGAAVDCGTGDKPCAGATGKVCMLERGGNMFCEKVFNCVQGGGVGAIIYGKSDQPACETFQGVLDFSGCPDPEAGWPVALTITRGQGDALKAMMKASKDLTITLDAREVSEPLPFDFLSGTSMATPTASGVAGVVWSAHTDCSAAEIRAAISWTALDVGKAGYDREYGYGIVQAAAAHKYLLEHPCTGGAATEPPRSSPKPPVTNPALRTLSIESSATAGSPGAIRTASLGSSLEFTFTVGKTADQQVIANVPIRVTPTRHLVCDTLRVTTDATGVAAVKCSGKSTGLATLTAAIGGGNRTVTAVDKVRVVRPRTP